MPRALVLGCLAFAVISGCGDPEPQAGSTAPKPVEPAPYQIVANLRQTMLWILEPAAEVIWDSAGFVITAEGETDLSPSTEAGWDLVRNNAALVAESGNLLMMPERSMGTEWVAYAQAMIGAGRGVMAAAEVRDAEALFDAGGDLYQTCRACHTQYLVPIAQARSTR